MTTKIKELKAEKSGERKLVRVTLEKDGKEYFFTAKATDVTDEDRFNSLLRVWTTQAIPEQEREGKMTDEQLEEDLKRIKAKKIKGKKI